MDRNVCSLSLKHLFISGLWKRIREMEQVYFVMETIHTRASGCKIVLTGLVDKNFRMGTYFMVNSSMGVSRNGDNTLGKRGYFNLTKGNSRRTRFVVRESCVVERGRLGRASLIAIEIFKLMLNVVLEIRHLKVK